MSALHVSLSSVAFLVSLASSQLAELLGAITTLVRAISSVYALVGLAVAGLSKGFAAELTLVWTLLGVCAYMTDQYGLVDKTLTAVFTLKI